MIRKKLVRLQSQDDNAGSTVIFETPAPTPIVSFALFSPSLNLLDIDVLELARQYVFYVALYNM